jgi:hypothetical protein
LSCSSNVGTVIALGTAVGLVALTPGYMTMVSDLFLVPSVLFLFVMLSLHDESSATYASGVASVLDMQSQSTLTVSIILIEYLLFAGFCIPLWLMYSSYAMSMSLLVFCVWMTLTRLT